MKSWLESVNDDIQKQFEVTGDEVDFEIIYFPDGKVLLKNYKGLMTDEEALAWMKKQNINASNHGVLNLPKKEE